MSVFPFIHVFILSFLIHRNVLAKCISLTITYPCSQTNSYPLIRISLIFTFTSFRAGRWGWEGEGWGGGGLAGGPRGGGREGEVEYGVVGG